MPRERPTWPDVYVASVHIVLQPHITMQSELSKSTPSNMGNMPNCRMDCTIMGTRQMLPGDSEWFTAPPAFDDRLVH